KTPEQPLNKKKPPGGGGNQAASNQHRQGGIWRPLIAVFCNETGLHEACQINPPTPADIERTLDLHCPRVGGPMADPVQPVTMLAEAALPTRFGEFKVVAFEIGDSPGEAVALLHGPLLADTIPLVRLHSECLTGDVLGSLRCDCGQQLV